MQLLADPATFAEWLMQSGHATRELVVRATIEGQRSFAWSTIVPLLSSLLGAAIGGGIAMRVQQRAIASQEATTRLGHSILAHQRHFEAKRTEIERIYKLAERIGRDVLQLMMQAPKVALDANVGNAGPLHRLRNRLMISTQFHAPDCTALATDFNHACTGFIRAMVTLSAEVAATRALGLEAVSRLSPEAERFKRTRQELLVKLLEARDAADRSALHAAEGKVAS